MLSAVTLDEKNVELVESSPHFVLFFTPWSSHCKKLAPVWEELASRHNKEQERMVTIAKTDCTMSPTFCSSEGVTGFPTVKFYKNGFEREEGVKYQGNRDIKHLEQFLSEQLGLDNSDVNHADTDSDEAVVEDGLYTLTSASFDSVVGQGDTFIEFYAPWSAQCQRLARIWDDLAKSFEKDEQVKIAEVDCIQYPDICRRQGVKGYPSLHYFRNGEKLDMFKGARTLAELKDFVKDEKACTGFDASDDEDKAVVELGRDNFEEEIRTGFAFVHFYTDWCRHCKSLEKTWELLAEKYQGDSQVTIGHVDCSAADNINHELCEENDVDGVPTINAYREGVKAGEHTGKRELEDLEEFVEQQLHGEDDDKVENEADDV